MEPTKWVMNEYHTLMVRIIFYVLTKILPRWTLSCYCDIEILYGLAIMLPLLEEVNILMKLA